MSGTFRTIVKPPESDIKFTYQDELLLIGSCFTENIGKKLINLKFNADINPAGIIYNPVSIKNILNFLIEEKQFSEKDLFYYNRHWNSLYHHGSFSSPDINVVLDNINSGINHSATTLRKAKLLFISFGTAWVYETKKKGIIVSNCHKLPSTEFNYYLLDLADIINDYRNLLQSISKVNPSINIIFTVSPIRHWKDSPFGNQVSKATLLLVIDKLLKEFPNTNYFPAYEIVMDDLRDYRFYEDDMLHINSLATEYIWNIFVNTYLELSSIKIMKEVENIIKAASHKPFDITNDSFKTFILKQLDKITTLKKQFPFLNLEKEKNYFTEIIQNK
ncbi:MAG: GSCFA domain-containing protein [Bacteroidia bacterium]|nr:GSCFA domain-containing protein [Bacteroidia bacterium]